MTRRASTRGEGRAGAARISVKVPLDLKRRLRTEAKRAGLSLSEWVRVRLEFGGTDPSEVRAFLQELLKLGEKITRTNAELAQRAESAARKREVHEERMAEARRQGRQIGEQLLAQGWFPIPRQR